ncbi:hypothetical protein TWF481_002869 [Arthrobotrys musiformis]|uniref:Uncharacterized protein n=1 Tax=Arthrobotrys musiformis TaxID=47236 RepID=A0AAV9VSK7_9PEZI
MANSLSLAILKYRLDAISGPEEPKTLQELERFIEPLQSLKTSLLKDGPKKDYARKQYTSTQKLLLTNDQKRHLMT